MTETCPRCLAPLALIETENPGLPGDTIWTTGCPRCAPPERSGGAP